MVSQNPVYYKQDWVELANENTWDSWAIGEAGIREGLEKYWARSSLDWQVRDPPS